MVRRHVVEGDSKIALHDATTGALYLLGPLQWRIVEFADGTRDIAEIAAAAASGDAVPLVETVCVLDDLTAAGLVEEGARTEAPPLDRAGGDALRESLADRPVEALPGFTLRCEGRGECCRSYSSIAVTAKDAARSRRLTLLADQLTPFTGTGRSDLFAMPLVDGACGERLADGRCRIHAEEGEAAKPVGCRTYPITLVDDGETMRASVACECSCVFWSLDHSAEASAPAPSGGLLPGVAKVSDLPPETTLRRLSEHFAVTPRTMLTRRDIARWSRSALAIPAVENPVALLLEQSIALRKLAFTEGGHPEDAGAETLLDVLAAAIERFAKEAAAGAEAAEGWRAPSDRVRVARRLVADATARLRDRARLSALADTVTRAADEMFFVRATLFGLLLPAPLAQSLADAAARLVVARELGDAEGGAHHPIATVEMVYRGLSA